MKKLKDDGASKPYLTWLLTFFVAWKLLLLGVACASPGPGYDTSARILFDQYDVHEHSWTSQVVEHLTLRLTRWDALYFSTSSARGHLYEQEWAFSWFMSRLTATLANGALSHLVLVVILRLSNTFSVPILSSHIAHYQTRSQRHTHFSYLPSRSSNHSLPSRPPHRTSWARAQAGNRFHCGMSAHSLASWTLLVRSLWREHFRLHNFPGHTVLRPRSGTDLSTRSTITPP
jgi:hypothetical protein